jgi:hypothetical protein
LQLLVIDYPPLAAGIVIARRKPHRGCALA